MVAPGYVLDACVLYPVVVRDLLLTAAVFDLYEPKWSLEILDEMRRNIVADNTHITIDDIDRKLIAPMSRQFPEAVVEGHEKLIRAMDNHVKDRHVAAAAIRTRARAIITYNVRDFGGAALPTAGVEIIAPPQLTRTWLAEAPEVVATLIDAMARRKKNPPLTSSDVIEALLRQQGFASMERELHSLDLPSQ